MDSIWFGIKFISASLWSFDVLNKCQHFLSCSSRHQNFWIDCQINHQKLPIPWLPVTEIGCERKIFGTKDFTNSSDWICDWVWTEKQRMRRKLRRELCYRIPSEPWSESWRWYRSLKILRMVLVWLKTCHSVETLRKVEDDRNCDKLFGTKSGYSSERRVADEIWRWWWWGADEMKVFRW